MSKGYLGSTTPKENKDNWSTPIEIFNTLNLGFDFDCDVAADDKNHKVDLCYFTEEDNALEQEWMDCNWCNPPYSDIQPWVNKAAEESNKGRTTVMLIPSDTSTDWFNTCWDTASDIWFVHGRISFISSLTGKPVSGNNKGSMVVVWDGEEYHGDPCVKRVERDWLMGLTT